LAQERVHPVPAELERWAAPSDELEVTGRLVE
jgi:hypothetical protein